MSDRVSNIESKSRRRCLGRIETDHPFGGFSASTFAHFRRDAAERIDDSLQFIRGSTATDRYLQRFLRGLGEAKDAAATDITKFNMQMFLNLRYLITVLSLFTLAWAQRAERAATSAESDSSPEIERLVKSFGGEWKLSKLLSTVSSSPPTVLVKEPRE